MSEYDESTDVVLASESLMERKRQAYHLKLRGYKPDQIAKMMDRSTDTIRKYLKDQHILLKEANESVNSEDYVSELREEFSLLRMEAWSNYSKANRMQDKVKILNVLAKLRIDETKSLHDLGALRKSAQKVEHEHSHKVEGSVDVNISEERLDALVAVMVGEEMGVRPEELMSMSGGDSVYPGLPAAIIDAEYEEIELLPVPHQKTFDIEKG